MTDDLVKLDFALDPTEWHQTAVERVWARKIPTDDGTLAVELQNTPFHARGVSHLDIVRATETAGHLTFQCPLLPSGHSTYRLLLNGPSPGFAAAWDRLAQHGCTYERGDIQGRRIFAVDVPANADIHAVYRALQDGAAQGIWDFDEGHCGHRV
jgi:hypothetical protein